MDFHDFEELGLSISIDFHWFWKAWSQNFNGFPWILKGLGLQFQWISIDFERIDPLISMDFHTFWREIAPLFVHLGPGSMCNIGVVVNQRKHKHTQARRLCSQNLNVKLEPHAGTQIRSHIMRFEEYATPCAHMLHENRRPTPPTGWISKLLLYLFLFLHLVQCLRGALK